MKLTLKHLVLFNTISLRGIGRGCNDLEREEIALLTPDEWIEFAKAYHEWNGDPETFTERTHYILPDFAVEAYIRHLLIKDKMETL